MLRQFALWRTLRNALRQKRDLFGGGGQRGFAALLEALSTKIAMFLPSRGRLTQELTTLRLLLQSTAVDETEISTVQIALD